MGSEATCRAEYNGRASKGTALVETDHVLFRGEYHVKVLFNDIVGVSANEGRLTVLTDTAELQLQLGRVAERWKEKIEHPASLLNKLGVKPGLSIGALGPRGEEILRLLKLTGSPGKANLVFLGAEQVSDLSCIPKAARRIVQDGCLWVIYPKGQKHIREKDVITAGRAAGLNDVKVVSFSPTHTGLKFVIPLATRGKK